MMQQMRGNIHCTSHMSLRTQEPGPPPSSWMLVWTLDTSHDPSPGTKQDWAGKAREKTACQPVSKQKGKKKGGKGGKKMLHPLLSIPIPPRPYSRYTHELDIVPLSGLSGHGCPCIRLARLFVQSFVCSIGRSPTRCSNNREPYAFM